MPVVERPDKPSLVVLPARSGAVVAETQVLVVGGGPAGLGAALGAAAGGAEVILVERYGFLGGSATAALVNPISWFHTAVKVRSPGTSFRIFPNDYECGRPVIRGVLSQLIDRLVEKGGALAPSAETGYTVPFDPEALKLVAERLVDEAGVGILLHALASQVLLDGNTVSGAVFETKSGPVVIRADVIVDGTGDGDIAYLAGAPCEVGREQDGLVQPASTLFRVSGFRPEAFADFVSDHPDDWRSVHGLSALLRETASSRGSPFPREDVLFFGTTRPDELTINSTRIPRVLGTDVHDLTRAELEGRRQVEEVMSFLHDHVPGFEQAYVAVSGTQVGIRETRRILGAYVLTADDVIHARRFPDVIARNTYPMDIHNPAGIGTQLVRVPDGEAYDIPLRCLVPVGIDGLLVGGRCISGTHEASSSYRVIPAAIATGQAAGVCAALAARSGIPAGRVPAAEVQTELMRQGADLGGTEAGTGGG